MPLFTSRRSQTDIQRRHPAMESLESRTYFSLPTLIVTVPGPLPASEIAGLTVNEKIAVNIANDGPGPLKGGFDLTLFASVDPTLGSDAIQLVRHAYPGGVVVQSGKNRKFTLNVKSYNVNLNNNYYILAEVSQGLVGGVTGSSTTTIAVTPQQIDLSDSVGPIRANGLAGHLFPVTVVVANGGNVVAKGNLAVNFGASESTTGSSPFNLATLSKRIRILPGKSQTLHFLVPLPLGIPTGNQFIVADVDPGDVYNETNLMNNIAVSAEPVSVT